MNKIFKVIYSKAKHCYVVASEFAKSYSKGGGSRTLRRAAVVFLAAAVYAAAGSAFANDGGDYVGNDYIGKAGTNPPYTLKIDSDIMIKGSAYGHKEDGNQNVSKASVEMTAGKIYYNNYGDILYKDLLGGYSNNGNATSNSVIFSGEVNKVFGGSTNGGYAASNSVTISGGTVYEKVYGGYSKNGSAASNSVNISGGTINGSVSGGYSSNSGDAKENQVTMTGGVIAYNNSINNSGNLYGGYSKKGNAASNSVNISGGTINGYVSGGYAFWKWFF